MLDNATSFAKRLQALRKKAELSQYALAKRSGLSKQAVSNLEMGNREPTWQTVQLLARALGVDCRAFADPDLPLPPESETAVKPRGRPRKTPAEGPAPKKKRKTD